MAASDSTGDLLACLCRLAGKPRRANHGDVFRIKVVSNDGVECAVRLGPISMNRARPSGKTLNDIADKLHLSRSGIGDTLASMTPDDLIAHLQGFTENELKPPQYRS